MSNSKIPALGLLGSHQNVKSYFAIQTRQLFGNKCKLHVSLRSRIKLFTSSDEDVYPNNLTDVPIDSLPLTCSFGKTLNDGKYLAVADENGFVFIYDTKGKMGSGPHNTWKAHDNAIFDIAWSVEDHYLITGSGDQVSIVWDVETMQYVSVLQSHKNSVKSVTTHPTDKNIFVTGGRDGNIFVFDIRCATSTNSDIDYHFHTPVNSIKNAHVIKSEDNLKSSIRKTKKMIQRSSVTSVEFVDGNSFISAGSSDGLIKLWDIRKNGSYTNKEIPIPVYSSKPMNKNRIFGISSVSIDKSSGSIFAACMDDTIYQFNVRNLDTIVKTFSAKTFRNGSFYIKNRVSCDGKYLACGSGDSNLHIWEISGPQSAPFLLSGHSREITGVSWSPNDFGQIATCSDDRTVRLWRLDETENSDYGNNSAICKVEEGQLSENTAICSLGDSENIPPGRSIKRLKKLRRNGSITDYFSSEL